VERVEKRIYEGVATVTFQMPVELLERLDGLAGSMGKDRDIVLAEALRMYLSDCNEFVGKYDGEVRSEERI
jgi:predicted DNA-binding protein